MDVSLRDPRQPIWQPRIAIRIEPGGLVPANTAHALIVPHATFLKKIDSVVELYAFQIRIRIVAIAPARHVEKVSPIFWQIIKELLQRSIVDSSG